MIAALGDVKFPHVLDNDATCVCCGFDGAEWHHWRHSTHEGQALQTPQPLCITSVYLRDQRIAAAKRQGLFDEPDRGSEDPLENYYDESAWDYLP